MRRSSFQRTARGDTSWKDDDDRQSDDRRRPDLTVIHAERSAIADMLETLTPDQWATPSLCTGWTVHGAAAHLVASAEHTAPSFIIGMAPSGFRFNAMIERDVRRFGALEPDEIVARLRARTTTTNRPPAPVMAMLGEVVGHGEDIRRPLGLSRVVPPKASAGCLEM